MMRPQPISPGCASAVQFLAKNHTQAVQKQDKGHTRPEP